MYDLEEVTSIAIDNIDIIFDYFGIDDYDDFGDRIKLSCPIHEGDSNDSLVIYKNTGHWKCYSNHCEQEKIDDKTIGANLLGLIRGLSFANGKTITYKEAFQLCLSILKINDLTALDNADIENNQFVKVVQNLKNDIKQSEKKVDRKSLRKFLQIPSKYFVDRGYDHKILDKYDVGLCASPKSEMYNRVVVPIYNEDYMIGCIGRRTKEFMNPKWKILENFRSENYLYNLWFAKEEIKRKETAILVEGQSDVWRLEENNIHYSLGLFGDSLTNAQKKLLETTGAINVVIITDNDLAGLNARSKIEEQLKLTYNIYHITPSQKDVGDMSKEEIKETIFNNLIKWGIE